MIGSYRPGSDNIVCKQMQLSPHLPSERSKHPLCGSNLPLQVLLSYAILSLSQMMCKLVNPPMELWISKMHEVAVTVPSEPYQQLIRRSGLHLIRRCRIWYTIHDCMFGTSSIRQCQSQQCEMVISSDTSDAVYVNDTALTCSSMMPKRHCNSLWRRPSRIHDASPA